MIRNIPLSASSVDDCTEGAEVIHNVIIKHGADRHAAEWIVAFFTIVENGEPAQYSTMCDSHENMELIEASTALGLAKIDV